MSNLHDVGITLKVDNVELPWISDVYTNKDYELSFVLHTEARDFENWANPDYYYTYDNATVQDLYAQSTRATDPDKAANPAQAGREDRRRRPGRRLAVQRRIGPRDRHRRDRLPVGERQRAHEPGGPRQDQELTDG